MTLGPIDGNRPPTVDNSQDEAEKAKENDDAQPAVVPQTATGTRLKGKGFGKFKISQSNAGQGPSISQPPAPKNDAADDSAAGA